MPRARTGTRYEYKYPYRYIPGSVPGIYQVAYRYIPGSVPGSVPGILVTGYRCEVTGTRTPSTVNTLDAPIRCMSEL